MPSQTYNQERARYMTLVSIAFAVFITVWVEPVPKVLEPLHAAHSIHGEAFARILLTMLLGGVTFLMLVCLWWWYAMFFPLFNMTGRLRTYVYDLVTFGCFAVAFKMWDQPSIFSFAVLISAGFIGVRFYFALSSIWNEAKDRDKLRRCFVLRCALGVVVAILIAAVVNLALSWGDSKHPNLIIIIMLTVLALGVAVSFMGAMLIEGRLPKGFDDWLAGKHRRSKKLDAVR